LIDPNLQIVRRDPRELLAYERNARLHPPEQIEALRGSLRRFGFYSPALLKDDDTTIGVGHGRVEAAIAEGLADVPTITLRGLSEEEWRALVIADNRLAEGASWDFDTLKLELGELDALGFDLGVTGFSLEGLGEPPAAGASTSTGSLMERFGIAPFSVLNAREGWWQDRKRAWIALGIRSEVGRGENLLKLSETLLEPDPAKRAAKAKAPPETASLKGGLTVGTTIHPYDESGKKRNARAAAGKPAGNLYTTTTPAKDPGFYDKKRKAEAALGRELHIDEFREHFYDPPEEASAAGTSIFDPVLAELAYRWWSPPGGLILDPFAGGSVRGIVAARLGRSYVGIDLRQEQVDANRVQGAMILGQAGDAPADWICGDSLQLPELEIGPADFIFSCPPYADLEVYSDDPRDLSTMDYGAFLGAYRQIIALAAAKLKPNRFACFVVGDVRAPDGGYRGFVRDTELAFEEAGLRLYNEAILVTAAGSLPLRAGRTFDASRKLGKTHQNILVFVKGDPFAATKAIGPCDFGEIGAELVDEAPKEPGSNPASTGAPARQNPAESGGIRVESTPFGERLLSLGEDT
jgi:DNA modification methylase